jgi:hypothetical protein
MTPLKIKPKNVDFETKYRPRFMLTFFLEIIFGILLWDQAARSGPDDFEGKLVDPAAHGYDKN